MPEIESLVITKYEICGRLKPDQSQKPQLEGRNVVFSNVDETSQPQQTTKTDSNGKFCILLNIPITEERKVNDQLTAQLFTNL